MPFYMMVSAISCFNVSMQGFIRQTPAFIVYQYGFTKYLGSINQAKIAEALIAHYVPLAIGGVLLGFVIEKKGAKMYFAALGGVLLVLGHILNLILPKCGAVDNQDWENAACWTAYLPILTSAVGQVVFPVILMSSVTYFAIH